MLIHAHTMIFKEGLCMQRNFVTNQLYQEADQVRYKHLNLPSYPSGPLDEQPTISTLAYKSPQSSSSFALMPTEKHKVVEEDLCELPTERVTAIATLALGERGGSFREIPQLIVYTAGASVIVGLYMVIPLMVMLGAFLPETWNRFLIAIEILVLGEFAVCTILMRTTKKRPAATLTVQQPLQEKRVVRTGDSRVFRRARLSNSTAGVRAYRSISMASRKHQVS